MIFSRLFGQPRKTPNISIKNPNGKIARFANLDENTGMYTFDYAGMHKHEYRDKYPLPSEETIRSWNEQYEKILNGPVLYECNRCGLPDTYENISGGLEHSRHECETAGFMFRVYGAISDGAKIDPTNFMAEIADVLENTRFQDEAVYSTLPYTLRYDDWYISFNIKPYKKTDNLAPQEWIRKYQLMKENT